MIHLDSRADFPTFEDYCREKWGWNRAYSGKLIAAASVMQALPEDVSHGIQNERQARELAKIEPASASRLRTVAADGHKPERGAGKVFYLLSGAIYRAFLSTVIRPLSLTDASKGKTSGN